MNTNTDTAQCQKCGTKFSGEFCATCGNPKTLKRIDGRYVLSEIESVLNFDKGIFYTIKELIVRPGKTVHKFINTDRSGLVKPLSFVIICSFLYTIAQQFLRFEDKYVSAGGLGDSSVGVIFEWILKNYGYTNILMSVFIAGWIKLFFKKYRYNFFEIVILLCFVMGIGMLYYTAFGLLEVITNINVLKTGAVLSFIYTAWAIGQFFNHKKALSYIKGLVAYVLGMISFYTLAMLLGLAIDLVAKR
ncbi:DUF3667 domain-containing protein [Neptunitalea lumnitzerae]|uniref:DUF3667 domain-containing protein n=1 Tax=Neptunitalea lumnitzerae TaxID=2965509 RepID=A0ABQ5MKC7_9FLAO|nr:DUF3667 domain-containing protein [Neptunitalea sp. Y10]GLB49862.1 hypothetical protein Y10_22300 [Neptunitalea sp. Y10]